MLAGYKTYIVAAIMVGYELLGYFAHGKVPDINVLLNGLGLAALRKGVAGK